METEIFLGKGWKNMQIWEHNSLDKEESMTTSTHEPAMLEPAPIWLSTLAALLVVTGFYRYVRNPMYVGFAAGWIGLWIVFGHASVVAIAVVAAVALGVHLFVMFYEEPTLRGKFGADYEKYCANVHRWLPRLTAWTKS